MTQEPEVYWMLMTPMKKFHAFPNDSGQTLCKRWFMGGAAPAVGWAEYEGESVKCKSCLKKLDSLHSTNKKEV